MLATAFRQLLWCHPNSSSQCLRERPQSSGSTLHSGTGQTAMWRMLRGQFCEEVLSTAVCDEQWYGFLEVTEGREWRVEISHCPAFSETLHGAVRNELRIVASTSVRAVSSEEHVGAVVLQSENSTASAHTHWGHMAAERQCSMLCLRQDGRRNVYLTVLSVQCPEWGTRGSGMPDLGMCAGHDAPSMALLPAGETVTAAESKREGERCEWDPVGVPPPSPPLWAQLGGALPAGTAAGPLLTCALVGGKTAVLALALRRLLPTPVPVAS